jgi:hypothetical protein
MLRCSVISRYFAHFAVASLVVLIVHGWCYSSRLCAASGGESRLRVMIETDAGGDPDDEQSLVRFLLYTSEWDVEGIIANRPTARDGENLNTVRTGLGIVRRQIDAYGECYPNLVQHDPRFPTAEFLHARTVPGHNEVDDGVQLLIDAVDRDDPRPLWFCNWGTDEGAALSCLRRALDRVLAERGPDGYAKFKSRIRLSSSDEFGAHTYDIAPAFPFWVDTFRPEIDRRRWYHRFSTITATAGGFDIERDCRTGHGPLGALYPTNTTHPQKEGDSMSFTYLIPIGMNDPDEPNWGSWAGRYGLQDQANGRQYFWANQSDTWHATTNRENTLARWAEHLQNDFRARLDWCVNPRDQANHPPKVSVNGKLRRTAKPGEVIILDGTSSTDSDGDQLHLEWMHYAEASVNSSNIELRDADTSRAVSTVPDASPGSEFHCILTVTDNGEPALTRYARVIVTVAGN